MLIHSSTATETAKSLQASLETLGCLVNILIKGMEHIPNIFISFNTYLFLEVINILI